MLRDEASMSSLHTPWACLWRLCQKSPFKWIHFVDPDTGTRPKEESLVLQPSQTIFAFVPNLVSRDLHDVQIPSVSDLLDIALYSLGNGRQPPTNPAEHAIPTNGTVFELPMDTLKQQISAGSRCI